MNNFYTILTELQSTTVGKCADKCIEVYDENDKLVGTFKTNDEIYKKWKVMPKGYTKKNVSK